MSEFPRAQLAERIAALARDGIYVGTSSWKYEGWLGMVYSPENYLRYFKNGPPKLQKDRFQRTCLAEYSQTFKTVCLDAGFYQFPTAKLLDGYFSQVPPDFRMSIKVTEDITVKKFPNLPRYGRRAGTVNERFLDADLFVGSFLTPLAPYQAQVGTLFFEFSHFHVGDWERGREFVAYLDAFLGKLPKGWDYSIEIRNENLLHPRYFEVLREHGVAHTFNSWFRMPPVVEQMKMIGNETADFSAARFLLKAGRSYEQAVKSFQPYAEIKGPYQEGRDALAKLLTPAGSNRTKRRYIYVNNRLEGCAPWTIVAALEVAVAGSSGTETK